MAKCNYCQKESKKLHDYFLRKEGLKEIWIKICKSCLEKIEKTNESNPYNKRG